MKKLLFLAFLGSSWLYAQELGQTSWIDSSHSKVKNFFYNTADGINDWFGDDEKNAKSEVRIIMDTGWDRHDHFSIKPKIRARVSLPNLNEKLHLVVGDEKLEDNRDTSLNAAEELNPDKTYDPKNTRNENSSVGLLWQPTEDKFINTSFKVGLRSGGDLHFRAKAYKDFYHGNNIRTHIEQLYRYGINSKNYARTSLEFRHLEPNSNVAEFNETQIHYSHKNDEQWSWNNSLYRQHQLGEDKYFKYGIYADGRFDEGHKFNRYGPFVGYRTSIGRPWFFIQPELSFYNNKDKNYDHNLGVFVRFEAKF